jgi:small subunit ribosomal protein S1
MSNPARDDSFASLFEQTSGAHAKQRRYHTGETVEVAIVAIAREAVFADLGGKQEGVFERVAFTDPEGKLRVELGSRVSAVVDSIDSATGQVRLRPVVIRNAETGDVGVTGGGGGGGGKSAQPVLAEGARVKGRVTGVERYGVFVQIEGTNGRSGRGLVPVSETATSRGADLKKHFAVGQDVEAKILRIEEDGKIRLSFSALGADDERGIFEAFKAKGGTEEAAKPEAGKPQQQQRKEKPAPRNFGTLGDLLGKVQPAAPKPAAPAKKDAPKKDAPKPAAPKGKR